MSLHLLENKIICQDSLEVMKQIPDKAIDVIITDPPYGLDKKLSQGSGKLKARRFKTLYDDKTWDVKLSDEYFTQMFRISKHQIIFGGNYYQLPATRGFVVWDKQQPWKNFSACEYIWTSYDVPSKIFRHLPEKNKVHPTQKPIALMRYLIDVFNCSGIILAPFVGAGTTVVACKEAGHTFIGIDIMPEYCKISEDLLRQEELF